MRNTPAASADLMMMFLVDARLPVAGHTQSASLEPAIAAGLTSGQIPDYIATRLATVTRVEAACAVVALHRLRQGLDLREVAQAWAARTPSPAMRATSRAQARALLRLLTRLWPNATSVLEVDQADVPRALVLAAASDIATLSPAALARLIGYDDVQTVAAAALKLVPMDPLVATSWVHDALPSIDALAAEVCTLTRPSEIPIAGAPQIEAWAQAHAVASRRLFSA